MIEIEVPKIYEPCFNMADVLYRGVLPDFHWLTYDPVRAHRKEAFIFQNLIKQAALLNGVFDICADQFVGSFKESLCRY